MKNQEINNLLEECKNDLLGLKIPISNNIKEDVIITNAKKTFGNCLCETHKKKDIYKKIYSIKISKYVLNAKKIKEIIYHELIHSCEECMNHGKLWQKYANIVNENLGTKISRTANASYLGLEKPIEKTQKKNKYKITCLGCGKVFYRQKLCNVVKDPNSYRCIDCGGDFKVEKLTD